MKAARTSIAERIAEHACADAGGSDACGTCIICLDKHPRPIQSGCGCRGDAGLAHIACRVTAVEHAIQSGRQDANDAWSLCATCGQHFTGVMGMGLASARWRQAQRLPETNRERVHAAAGLGSALHYLSADADAESILRCALAWAKRVFGSDDVNVIDISSALATSISKDQGKLAEAEAIQRHCYSESVRLRGADDLETVKCASSFANTLALRGKYAEAMPLFQAVFAARKRMCGPEHALTASAALFLADTFSGLGMLDEAVAMYSEYLPVVKRVHGPEHMSFLSNNVALAVCLARSGRLSEGVSMMEEMLPMVKRVFGVDHYFTKSTSRTLLTMRGEAARQGKRRVKGNKGQM
jgi:hypothetical protein